MNVLDPASFDSLPPAKLALLLDVEGCEGAERRSGEGGWTRADAAAALRQQLSTPLLPDLLVVPGAERGRLERLVETHPQMQTFGTQLTGPDPSAELLDTLKRWARFMGDQPGSPLHGGPATVLYYAAIAAALARAGQRITRLSDSQLQAGFEWAMIQEGAEVLREGFDAALAVLSPV